ncbi:hypothetical protein L1887_48988 [Cichorium endivia]|nr:hypothetical protein L1887_48988 [Cichorium endivia]
MLVLVRGDVWGRCADGSGCLWTGREGFVGAQERGRDREGQRRTRRRRRRTRSHPPRPILPGCKGRAAAAAAAAVAEGKRPGPVWGVCRRRCHRGCLDDRSWVYPWWACR